MNPDPLDFEKTMNIATAKRDGGYSYVEDDVLGQYRIVHSLGRGGMGEVYEVEHQTLGLRYALKLLATDFSTSPEALERFRREARVMAQLRHDYILSVDDFGETDNRHWLRMELAEGVPTRNGDKRLVSLQQLADANGGKLEQELVREIMAQILSGLAYAHERGVVHRDIKPSNILITDTPEGSVFKVADFGLVRLVGEEWLHKQAQLTMQRSMSLGMAVTIAAHSSEFEGSSTRSLLGTYEYMSPEQKRGEEATEKSDIYAVGLMAFRLLTGLHDVGFKLPSQLGLNLSEKWDELVASMMCLSFSAPNMSTE